MTGWVMHYVCESPHRGTRVRACVFCAGMYHLAAVIFLFMKFIVMCNAERGEQPGQVELN